jgi:photosynthetic reaction center cytochrome c subunit
VSPEEGCAYCHVVENYASDDIYTKIVSRNMLKMTKNINGEWTDHVADTGVTCYTCHRGNPVPEYIWFEQPNVEMGGGLNARNYSHNMANPETGLSSLPANVFSEYLEKSAEGIRVIGDTALPMPDDQDATIQATEASYGLMMHMSTSLGVNCTYCHNSRAFSVWSESTPQRITSWYGLRMVAALNDEWLVPLKPVYPEERLGPTGDAPKANCTTCHQGVNKPLNGISMLPDYPSLAGD